MIHKFRTVLSKTLSKIEMGSIIMAALGLIIFYQPLPVGRVLLSVGVYAWAGVFFLRAYLPPFSIPQQEHSKRFLSMVMALLWQVFHIASAVSAIGVLFYLLAEEGFRQLLMVGTAALTACLVVFLLVMFYSRESWRNFRSVVIKAGLLALLGIYALAPAFF